MEYGVKCQNVIEDLGIGLKVCSGVGKCRISELSILFCPDSGSGSEKNRSMRNDWGGPLTTHSEGITIATIT